MDEYYYQQHLQDVSSKHKTLLMKKIDGVLWDDRYKTFTKAVLEVAPEYFWYAPASGSGKHHPSYANNYGGLVMHTIAAIDYALALMRLDEYKVSLEEREIVLCSLFLHDILKFGTSNCYPTDRALFDHPALMKDLVFDVYKASEDQYELTRNEVAQIACCIWTHMGQWNIDPKTNSQLPLPQTKLERLVHLADYIASVRLSFDNPGLGE